MHALYGMVLHPTKKYPLIYGRVRNSLDKETPHTQVHRLMYMAYDRLTKLDECDGRGWKVEISHVCHNSICVNIEHLTMETHEKTTHSGSHWSYIKVITVNSVNMILFGVVFSL